MFKEEVVIEEADLKKSGYFISIGAGLNQKPLIETANSLGLKTISIDKNDVAPGFEISDVKILESTSEYRKIYSALRHIPLTDKIVAVGTRSYGKATYSAAYLSSKFKLVGTEPEVIKLFENKKSYLSFLNSKGLRTPKSYEWKNKSSLNKLLNEIEFPVILKPSMGNGKIGIEHFENKEEFKLRIDKNFPDSQKFVLEEFISGPEITVLGLSQNQKFHLCSITDKWTTSKAPFLEIAHTSPSRFQYLEAEIRIYIQNIIFYTNYSSGPFVAEFKIDRNGDLALLECNPEVGGEFLADQLIPHAYKYSYFESYVKILAGRTFTAPKQNAIPKNLITCIYYYLPPSFASKIKSIPDFLPSISENLFFEQNLKKENEMVDRSKGNNSRIKVIGITRTQDISTESWLDELSKRIEIGY